MAKNSYVLGKRIARGGMAEIYLGKAVGEAAFQRICAIKRILPHYSQDREFVEMFRDEAHICKRLQHANIVQVYDFTEVEGSYALIMEHVDGGDLRTLLSACEIARTRLAIPMSLYIAANAARALHYAHTKTDEITNEALGIVHRDVSPQNILISYEGEVKITDFGIASAENKITETRPGVVKGKYSYMSPEQVAAKPLDGRSDVFSLAIVLWEVLAMKRLFAGQTEVESIRKVQNCEIPFDLRELNSEINEELYQIVMKGLAKDRKQRYQTAAAFEKDLLKYLHSRYSDFTSSELGNFTKRILAKRRDKSQDDIKETLSQMASSQSQRRFDSSESPFSHQQSLLGLDEESIISSKKSIESGSLYQEASAYESKAMAPQALQHGATLQLKPIGNRPLSNFQTIRSTSIGTTNGRSTYPHAVNRKHTSHRTTRKRSWPMILLALFIIAGSAMFARHYIADDKLHIKIDSHPDSIQIVVNGRRVQEGFTKTPAMVSLKPGTYTFELIRPGYERQVLKVAGKQGETLELPKVYMKRLTQEILVPFEIVSPDKRLFINVDQGLYRGSTPMKIELTPNTMHSISFYIGDDQKKALKCSFQVNSSKPDETQVLTIRVFRDGKAKCSLKS